MRRPSREDGGTERLCDWGGAMVMVMVMVVVVAIAMAMAMVVMVTGCN